MIRTIHTLLFLSLAVSLPTTWFAVAAEGDDEPLFQPGNHCTGCHNGLHLEDGTDISIGTNWSASMMANAARDPYWHAGVRREVMDHPEAASVIEGECSRCHMPKSHHLELNRQVSPAVLAHLPLNAASTPDQVMAADGVSCTVCHQVKADNLGDESSFSGHFQVAGPGTGVRKAYGPFVPDAGLTRVMESATGHTQAESSHIQQSELCATCHTLFTHAIGHDGPPLAEQVPFLEWKLSDYAGEASCQECHMPALSDDAMVSSVLGRFQQAVSQHVFRGGNFVLPQIFRRFPAELAVSATRPALQASEMATREHLQSDSASVSVVSVAVKARRLAVTVHVANLAGHKLPTAYPSRRAWLHFRARDSQANVLLESGRFGDNGSIVGNDNDADGSVYEPHYEVVENGDQVQIYEDIMGTPDGKVTTGLLTASQYLKDNRLLPEGFEKEGAPVAVAVIGRALDDDNFEGGGDTVVYSMPAPASGPVIIDVALYYQPIGYRWARNLAEYDADEPRRFVYYFDQISRTSAIVLSSVTTRRNLSPSKPAPKVKTQ